jgi:hypothetical protein
MLAAYALDCANSLLQNKQQQYFSPEKEEKEKKEEKKDMQIKKQCSGGCQGF